MTDFRLQRINMVESQVRPSDVTDQRILRAMLEVPREKFAPEAIAYMDDAAPVALRAGAGAGAGSVRYLLAPRTFAKMVQLAAIEPGHVVLDVGCATGYSTAVLAKLAKSVVAVESDAALAGRATQLLRALGVSNATVIEGALTAGALKQAPFDAILINGAVAEMPQELCDQLKDGGRLVAIQAEGTFGRAQVWRRTGKIIDAMSAFDAGAELLPGFARKAEFSL